MWDNWVQKHKTYFLHLPFPWSCRLILWSLQDMATKKPVAKKVVESSESSDSDSEEVSV